MQKRPAKLFELGRYWIGTVAGSDRLYRFWYDAGTGEVRRKSLKTAALEDAKIALAAHVLREGSGRAEDTSAVAMISVFSRYWEGHSDNTRSRTAARLAGGKLLDFLGDDAKVAAFSSKRRQIEFMKALRKEDYAVGTIAHMMTMIQAALNYSVDKGDEEEPGLLLRAPAVISSEKAVAAALDEPEPPSRNWHPTLDQIAEFINACEPAEEYLVRFAVLKLAFASRSEATLQASPFALDREYRLFALNPPGRRQTKKHRPTLPVPDMLWPLLTKTWADGETYCHRNGKTLPHANKEWRRVVTRAELPPQMIPNSLRHFMATALRHAHKRYDVPRVPADEREMWMGHRRLSVHDSYGTFEPDYLSAAKEAVEAILVSLDEKLDKPLFRQFTAKSSGDMRVVR